MRHFGRLGLGTVQWGTVYGLANDNGITTGSEVSSILLAARDAGLVMLDTAALYGGAEAALGVHDLANFKVVTKTPRFATPSISKSQADELTATFYRSLEKLGVGSIYGLLIHHAEDLLSRGGNQLIERMQLLKLSGKVQRIGVSIYEKVQIDAVLKVFKPDIVQLPLNVLDQRLLVDGSLALLKSQNIEIHARSVFLQGLLLMNLHTQPDYFKPISPLLARWHAACAAQGLTPAQAALSFVRSIPEIDYCLIGVQSLAQFEGCLHDFTLDKHFDAVGLACDDPTFINPANWKLT